MRSDETHVLAIWFVSSAQSERSRPLPNLGFGHRPHRKHRARQTFLIQHVNHITLILGSVSTALESPLSTTMGNLGVVTRSNCVESEHYCSFVETVELDVAIAFDTGIGCYSLRMILNIRIDHGAVKIIAEVENQMIDAQLLCNPASVVDITHTAATGIAFTTPQSHGHSDHVVSLVAQNGRSYRGVDSSRHGHQNLHCAQATAVETNSE